MAIECITTVRDKSPAVFPNYTRKISFKTCSATIETDNFNSAYDELCITLSN